MLKNIYKLLVYLNFMQYLTNFYSLFTKFFRAVDPANQGSAYIPMHFEKKRSKDFFNFKLKNKWAVK